MPSLPPIFSLRGGSTWLNQNLLPPPPPPSAAIISRQKSEFIFMSIILILVILYIFIRHYYHYRLRQYQTRAFDIDERIQAAHESRLFTRFQVNMILQRQAAAAQPHTAEEEKEASAAATTTAFKDIKTAEKGDSVCAICIEGFKEEENCRVVESCGHFFHENCMDKWLRIESRCPLCRCFVHVIENQA